MTEAVRAAFTTIPTAKLEAAFEEAVKAVGSPELTVHTEESEGEYNAIALPEIPFRVDSLSLRDAKSDHVKFRLIGQQVIAARRLEAPVTVEYVTVAEWRQWEGSVIEAIRKELAKA